MALALDASVQVDFEEQASRHFNYLCFLDIGCAVGVTRLHYRLQYVLSIDIDTVLISC